MHRKILVNIVILLLVSSAVFLTLRYIYSLKNNISCLKDNVAVLENQKQNLLQALEKEKIAVKALNTKNANLKDYLRAMHKKLNKLFFGLDIAEEKANKLDVQLSVLKAEHSALLENQQSLTQENEAMKIKLSSIEELKKAIKELKRTKRLEGNRGFLIKNGQSSSTAKVKIEVTPVPGT